MLRLFTAISIPESVSGELEKLQPKGIDQVVASAPYQLHLTLHFTGDVSEVAFPEIHGRLKSISMSPFSVTLRGVGTFHHDQRPGFLWAGVELSPQLIDLRNRIRSELMELGYKNEDRSYKPHVTIARLDVPCAEVSDRFLKQNASSHTSFDVTRFSMYAVKRVANEPNYRQIAIYDLFH
jgi:2'-5' RNA ligase